MSHLVHFFSNQVSIGVAIIQGRALTVSLGLCAIEHGPPVLPTSEADLQILGQVH